jgi:hypothetical protein
MRGLAKLSVPLAVLALWAPAAALADADPASDVLLGSPAFFPYQPPVSSSLQNQLITELDRLRKQGLNLKVAIIQSPVDLGAIPNMFGHPQAYAEFLGREISFNQRQPLLVVMPGGFGLSNAGSPSALSGLRINRGGRSNGLTETAILAVRRIARQKGKDVATGRPSASGGSGSGVSPLITFAAPALLVVLGAFAATWWHRRRLDRNDL